jgi:CDP-6-deoxy-D-xylo-4-hexulose-3-dehydrase
MLKGKLKNKRKQIQIHLEKSGVQTRTIFTGNILRQPVAQKFEWDSFGTFDSSDSVMQNGILLGCHNQMTREKLDFTIEKLLEAEQCIA